MVNIDAELEIPLIMFYGCLMLLTLILLFGIIRIGQDANDYNHVTNNIAKMNTEPYVILVVDCE